MLSAFIRAELSYPAVPLAGQLVHQRFVHPGPLVLGMGSLTIRRPQQIGDRQYVISNCFESQDISV